MSNANNFKPEQFVDMQFVNKLKNSSFLDHLWGATPEGERRLLRAGC